jgi:hypothetical protein
MTNNKQQTAIEWLIEKCACADLRPELWEIIKQQAKEMHKEEITQAWKKGDGHFDKVSDKMSLEYYEKTYGGNNEQLQPNLGRRNPSR